MYIPIPVCNLYGSRWCHLSRMDSVCFSLREIDSWFAQWHDSSMIVISATRRKKSDRKYDQWCHHRQQQFSNDVNEWICFFIAVKNEISPSDFYRYTIKMESEPFKTQHDQNQRATQFIRQALEFDENSSKFHWYNKKIRMSSSFCHIISS